MPRELSKHTEEVFELAWYRPLVSAADLGLVSSLTNNAINNVLARGVENGLLGCVTLGRVRDAVKRYFYLKKSVRRMHEERGWPIEWYHTAAGIEALARRIEVAEMAYHYLPQLWQSDLSGNGRCRVYRELVDVGPNGEMVRRTELVERDWRGGRQAGFYWVGNQQQEAITIYDDGADRNNRLYAPVLLQPNFQKPTDFEGLRRDISNLMIEDDRWWRLHRLKASPVDFRPLVIILCPDRVSSAMARRNWREAHIGHNATVAVIIDAEGQVVQSMDHPPTALWRGFRPQRTSVDVRNVSVENLGDISAVVEGLKSGPYAAVNGREAWKLLWEIYCSPGIEPDQALSFLIRDQSKIRVVGKAERNARAKRKTKRKKTRGPKQEPVTDPLLKGMIDAKVITCLGGGLYLLPAGMALVADSLLRNRRAGTRLERVLERHGIFLKEGGAYRRKQSIHTVKTTESILQLRRHGFVAFAANGMIIEHWRGRRRVRVAPDAFVILPPGVLVAIEFERSATTPKALMGKAEKYRDLEIIGHPIPVLFITETEDAAKLVANLRYRYVLAASLDAVRQGPHGRAIYFDNRWLGRPGCWWAWRPNSEEPTPDAAINLGAELYFQDHRNGEWLVPVRRRFLRRQA